MLINLGKNFYNILNGAVKLCIEVCKRRSRRNINKPKWWNSQNEARLLHKNLAHGKYFLSQNENDKIEYEKLRRETKKMIRRSIKDLEIYIAYKTKSKTKEFYIYVRNKKVITTNIGPLHLDNGKETNTES